MRTERRETTDADRALTPLEHAALEMSLAGDDPRFDPLRKQLQVCHVKAREFSGVGFFSDFSVPDDTPRADLPSGTTHLSGPLVEMDGLEHGGGFELGITDGVLDYLEAYCYDEPWPDTEGAFTLRYFLDKPPEFP
jgi:hypothetical protein